MKTPLVALALSSLLGTTAARAQRDDRPVVLLPTVGLAAADGFTPAEDAIDRASAELSTALGHSKLATGEWFYGTQVPTVEQSARSLSTLRKKPIPRKVQKLLKKAEKAKAEFEYSTQAKLLASAITALSKQLEDASHIQALLDAEIELANAYLYANERAFAEAEFAKVIRMRPDKELDLKSFSPQAVDLFNQVKLRVLAEPTTELSIDVQPHGALIVQNGFTVGQSPKILTVRKGTYLIQIVAPGYEPLTRVVEVTADTARIDTPLRRDAPHQLADELLASLRTDTDLAATSPRAVSLGEKVGADVIVSGLTDVDGGFVLVAVRVGREIHRVVATFPESWTTTGAAFPNALDALAGPPTPGANYDLVTGGGPPLPLEPLGFDFDGYLLGLRGGAVRPAISPFASVGVAPVKGVCEQEDPPPYCYPWVWVVSGVVVAGVATGTYFILRSDDSGPRQHEIDLQIVAPPPSIGAGR